MVPNVTEENSAGQQHPEQSRREGSLCGSSATKDTETNASVLRQEGNLQSQQRSETTGDPSTAATDDVVRSMSDSFYEKNRRMHHRLTPKYIPHSSEQNGINSYHHDEAEASSFYAKKRDEVNTKLRRTSFIILSVWITLAIFAYATTPSEEMEYLTGIEQSAALLAAAILFVTCLTRVMPILVSSKKGIGRGAKLGGRLDTKITDNSKQESALSGALLGGITVQFIAMCTDTTMVFAKVPVRLDPILKSRVHMLRWCEWTPLAFFMTYMTELVDVPMDQDKSLKWKGIKISIPFLHALSQGLSTICGLLFPYCPGVWSWSILMFISCVLYLVIFARLHHKMKVFKTLQKGTTVDEIEIYDRSRLALRLLITCTVMWTLLVTGYYVSSLGPTLAPNTVLAHPALTMVSEATMDVVAKVIYMIIIIEVHGSVFDDSARAERRLSELRHMMSVVWDNSSDLIAISVKSPSGVATTIVNPTHRNYFGGEGETSDENKSHVNEDLQLMFTLQPEDLKSRRKKPRKKMLRQGSSFFQMSEYQREEAKRGGEFPNGWNAASDFHLPSKKESEDEGTLVSIADLMVQAWNTQGKESLFVSNIVSSSKGSVRCETKVNRLEENAIVVIARDTSEQYHRFEAEKKIVSETAARQKDAEANRFTRHEVKNGLLAAIGLFDSLKESLDDDTRKLKEAITEKGVGGAATETLTPEQQVNSLPQPMQKQGDLHNSPLAALTDKTMEERARCLSELNKTLHEVLDTILADAMARDVIHEVYEPKLEKVDIATVLSDVPCFNRERFPIVTFPSPLPFFAFDPQLLKYIHRNAVSNAWKYGKKGGAIMTEVRFNDGWLTLNVINLPGEHHDALVEMGSAASDIVFSPGKRLHNENAMKKNSQCVHHSSGDGAWIIRKCAKTLGGDCNIQFESNRTVFTLRCPATPFDEAMKDVVSVDCKNFHLGGLNVWGIAIDDSNIQRKLMGRLLSLLGIKSDRCIVMGKDAEETEGFVEFVIDFVERHPHDFFLIIADENLDMVNESSHHITVSGSMCIENIRKRLLPDQERRMLALVRSANDSAHDIAIYNSRAHGFLPKAPINKDKVKETVAPLWERRYPSLFKDEIISSDEDNETKDDVDPTSGGSLSKSSSVLNLKAAMNAEIMKSLDSIDAHCVQNETELEQTWPAIWEKLHTLLGDIKSLDESCTGRANAVNGIKLLRGPTLPQNFVARWMVIRSLVINAIKP